MMFPVVFSSEMTLDWDWIGPNTMGDLFTVSPGVRGNLQEAQEVLRKKERKKHQNDKKGGL